MGDRIPSFKKREISKETFYYLNSRNVLYKYFEIRLMEKLIYLY